MPLIHKAGIDAPALTGRSQSVADKTSTTLTYEGRFSDLANFRVTPPNGMVMEDSQVFSTGDGLGKLVCRFAMRDSSQSFNAVRTTFRVDMQEVTYDLEDHPHLAEVRDVVVKWLATDENKRTDDQGGFKFMTSSGTLQDVTGEAVKFCKAYMAGIKTFNRYYPVVERISIWRNPPGMSMNGRSFSGGSPRFSDKVGKYSEPPITLNGFDSGNWFQSKDSWSQNENETWTRTEQWTYTPEPSSGQNAWIYKEL